MEICSVEHLSNASLSFDDDDDRSGHVIVVDNGDVEALRLISSGMIPHLLVVAFRPKSEAPLTWRLDLMKLSKKMSFIATWCSRKNIMSALADIAAHEAISKLRYSARLLMGDATDVSDRNLRRERAVNTALDTLCSGMEVRR